MHRGGGVGNVNEASGGYKYSSFYEIKAISYFSQKSKMGNYLGGNYIFFMFDIYKLIFHTGSKFTLNHSISLHLYKINTFLYFPQKAMMAIML